MKCILCQQRKGKRFCPAKNTQICAHCCGTKRILEIDCPEDCEYLQVGRSHDFALENTRHLRTSDPVEMQKRARILENFSGVVMRIEYFLAEERRSARSLTDQDVVDALDLLLSSYKTEEKGILYEHVSSNLQVDGLRRRLREILETFRKPEEGQPSVPLSALIDCLRLIRDLASSHMQDRGHRGSYVEFLARTMPRNKEIESSKSSIILPG